MLGKGRFIIKGGKGKIGNGERQIAPQDIVLLYQDRSEDINKINTIVSGLDFTTKFNKNILNYHRIPVLTANNDNFSNPGLYFNPSPYVIIINSKKEFFFGVDKTKPKSRFNPRGTFIKLDKNLYNNKYNPIAVEFYCSADEEAVYKNGGISFYKLHPNHNAIANLNFTERNYNFSFYREELIESKDKNVNLPLRDLPLNGGTIATEAKAEVKESVLYVTIKAAKRTDSNTSGFSICILPVGYRPKRNFNVQFVSISGETFFGAIGTDGNIAVNNNKKANEMYLQVAIPL